MIRSTTFYILRHGQSEANIAGKFGHVPEAQLTKSGIEQAQKAAARFGSVHFDRIISSEFVRARQTAEIIAKERKLVVNTTHALRERSYGRLNGKTKKELQDELQDLYELYLQMPEREKFRHKLVADMESAEEALQRLLLYLREAALAYEGETVLMVCHVTLIRVLLIHLGYADYEELVSDNIENTAHIVVETDGADFFLKETHGVKKLVVTA